MANVRKRKWTTAKGEVKTAWVADYFDQERKRQIKTFDHKREADAWLVAARGEVARGVHTPESGSITVAEAAKLWLEKGALERLERSTLRQYQNHIDRHLTPSRIGTEKLAKLTAPMIEAFRDDLLRKNSRVMAGKVLASLKSILGEAQRRGLVAQNAAQPVRVSTKKRERRKLAVGQDIPSKEEVRAILAHAEAQAGGRWRPLLITATYTGMRSSELRGLAWKDVDFDRRMIRVRQRADAWGTMGAPKSAAGDREIPMSPQVVNTLREWRLAGPKGEAGLVFPNGAGRVESHANIANRGFYPVQEGAGVVKPGLRAATDERGKRLIGADGKPVMQPAVKPKYGMHALRHFFASVMIEQGFSPKRLQALLGHSSIQMTFDRYGHLFPSLEDDHAKFAAAELAIVG